MDMRPSITIMTNCIAAIYAFDPLVWKKTKHEAEMVKFLLAEMQSKSTIQKRSQFPVILTKYAGFIIWAKRNFLLFDQHSGA